MITAISPTTMSAPTGLHSTTLAAPGEVHVRVRGLLRANAICSCGWCGVRRHLKASAEVDAWEHAMRTACSVSFPLLSPW